MITTKEEKFAFIDCFRLSSSSWRCSVPTRVKVLPQRILIAHLSSQTLTMASNSFGILENPFEHLQKLILFIGTSWNKRLEVQLLQQEWMNFSTLMGSERDQAQLFALSGKSKTLFKLLWIVIKKVISIKIRGLELSTIWILIKRLSHYVGNSKVEMQMMALVWCEEKELLSFYRWMCWKFERARHQLQS